MKPRLHFSMIRSFHLADLFTIANGFCGVGALFSAMRYLTVEDVRYLYLAALLVPVALVFDILDGRIARWRHAASALGRELDSLADVISFGVAPAGIAYAAGLTSLVDQFILLYFVGCGLSRLARFNITAEALAGDREGPLLRGHAHPHQRDPAGAADARLPPGRALPRARVRG